MLPALVGVGLALAVAIFARLVGFDRERAFYPVVLVVVASYYDLFAVMAGGAALIPETIGFVLFAAAAAIGFRTSLWLVVAGLAGHGVFDLLHHALVENPGVPAWWPIWCLAYDVAAAACLAALLVKGGVSARAIRSA
ncbi:MAG: hypothetical protein QOF34_592 [Sphingomonadales bacterium]|jgi:hypothetical protein|nr:hypothetical protein [Sphingomonadales bacterium]